MTLFIDLLPLIEFLSVEDGTGFDNNLLVETLFLDHFSEEEMVLTAAVLGWWASHRYYECDKNINKKEKSKKEKVKSKKEEDKEGDRESGGV